MANLDEDVIELGSSDDEKEPAPKKKKPIKNVMVHIPNKLPEVTIKPASNRKINPISLAKSKAITVTKVSGSTHHKLSNPFAIKPAVNGKKQSLPRSVQIPIQPSVSINPAIKKPVIKKIATLPSGKMPIKIAQGISTAPKIIQPLPPGIIPPGITVKRTSQLQSTPKRFRPNPVNILSKRENAGLKNKKFVRDTVYVDLDEDDAAPSSVGPQWYLRPEEQDRTDEKSTLLEEKSDVDKTSKDEAGTTKKDIINEEEKETTVVKEATDLKEQNNKEPETPQYIEITIEDSPAKPQKNKRACEVSELAITIDDSPVKGASNKPEDGSGSDKETTASKEKNSKKKLEYPKQDEKESVEIEIELTPVNNPKNDKTDSQDVVLETEVVEIDESPLKQAESFHTSTPKKKQPLKLPLKTNNRFLFNPMSKQHKTATVLNSQSNLNDEKTATAAEEFHPVYQSFINLCLQLESSEDMSKIVDKKIKAYYKQVPKEYTESEVFTDMVASKISAMQASPEKLYLYVKDVVDELNLQRQIAKSQPVNVVTVNEEQEKLLYGEKSEFDLKRQRQIRKLEKTLKKLHRAIQKLEEQEVDFDDEEDSVYLLTERYKERMIRVHAKFCQLTNTKMPSEPRVQIDARPGQPKGPAKRLEKWINKKVPIGTPLPFPDFHDVLRCVRDANQEDKLCWNEADIMEEARDLFTRCGKKLQRRRQENEWRLAASRIQSESDPAEKSEDLKKALENNRQEASKKENEVLKKFADRQNQLNLEAVEIGDKEADESPVETDDEEQAEENNSKEKRKERLKRLLQKKSKKEEKASEKEESNVVTKELKKDNSQGNDSKPQIEKDDKSQTDTVINKEVSLSGNQNDHDQEHLSEKEIEAREAGSENVQTLSEDSSKIDSDIDELHLLQKLHSNVVDSSTSESSDSESPIAISDTLSSGDDKKRDCDVISIEDSSYSESEKNNELVSYSENKIVKESVDDQMEIECSDAGIEKKINKSNNDEYSESVEDILLASSDEEANNDVDSINYPISNDDIISEQSNDKSTKSVENTEVKNMIECENVETISVISVETADNVNAAEVTSINSVDMVEHDKVTDTVDMPDNATSVNAKEIKNTNINPKEKDNKTMTSITENDKTSTNHEMSGIESVITSVDNNKNAEVTGSQLTESCAGEDNETDKVDTIKVNGKNVGSGKTKSIVLNDKETEKSSDNLTGSEPMEVDDDKT